MGFSLKIFTLFSPSHEPRLLDGRRGTAARQADTADDDHHHAADLRGSLSSLSRGHQRLMKHICRKVGHARILGRMVSLSAEAGRRELDPGAAELFRRAEGEREHFRTFRSGRVEGAVEHFEKAAAADENKNDEQEIMGEKE